ncbi:YdcH family protein [Marinobacter caseinilyticus]|uniref:YdcH family protein n=1 Tax=Marinobacter caseinilyticus TaxID=2692195 RepID=UPI00140D3607|nr:YdcH family protein [Marinobacter caseinilyticus]
MSISDHALVIDFPQHRENISNLNKTDDHFRKLSKRYDELDKKIRGLEVREVPTSDDHFNDMKIERAHLKDTLYRELTRHEKRL